MADEMSETIICIALHKLPPVLVMHSGASPLALPSHASPSASHRGVARGLLVAISPPPPINYSQKNFKRINWENVQKQHNFALFLVIFGAFLSFFSCKFPEKVSNYSCQNAGTIANTCLPCDAMRSTVLVIVILSVRLSVCLSHSCTVSTWFNIRS